jgi:transposase
MPFVSSRPKLQLAQEEHEYLKKLKRSRTAPQRSIERAKFLLSYYENKSISHIAREFRTNRPKVERVIKKAIAYGIYDSLRDLPRKGRKRTISSEARAWIISLACMKPKDVGHPHEIWTLRLLAQHIRDRCRESGFPDLSKISPGTISKILSSSNIKPHKIYSYINQRDPDFEPKSVVVLHTYKQVELLKEKNENKEPIDQVIISYDEKPGIQAIENRYPDLMPIPGKYPTISRDCEYIRHGTLSLLAGIDLFTGNVHHKVFNKHRSIDFIEFLKYIDSIYPPEIKIVVILDNLKIHTSRETTKYLISVPQRFQFVFTPKHASWLNIIESLFSKMTRSFLRGIRVSSKEELIERIDQYFYEMNRMPVIFRWKYKMDEMAGGIQV